MHDIVTGYWKPNENDKAAGLAAGFGTTINIINGDIECGHWDQEESNRSDFYKSFMNYFGLNVGSEVTDCSSMSTSFPDNGAGSIASYWDKDWNGGNKCALVNYETPYSVFVHDGYKQCVKKNFS
jgi:hypothetical protein